MNETEQMLTSLLNCTRADLYAGGHDLTPRQQQALNEMRRRRSEGEPLQYILGDTDFMGLTLRVNEHVLVPRPETELLVEHALGLIRPLEENAEVRILDLGTGAGNIAIALARFMPHTYVVTVDVSREALSVARQNALAHNVADRIYFERMDMRAFLDDFEHLNTRYDLLISNPPYVKTSDLSELPGDVKREPQVALDGGNDGLLYIRPIIEKGPAFLRPEGGILIEIGDTQGEDVQRLVEHMYAGASCQILKDYSQRDRIARVEFHGKACH